MISSPFPSVLFLLAVEIAILFVSQSKRFEKYFHFIPSVFWIYFIPIIAASTGLLVFDERLYRDISDIFLPFSLILLLSGVNIPGIARLGGQALIMMFAGSIGIVLVTPSVFYLVKKWVGPEMWQGFGALSGSWIGGSANMIAVKEAIGAPDAVFTPMVIVDTVVPYVWMAILVAGSVFQAKYDKWNRSEFSFNHDPSAGHTDSTGVFSLKNVLTVTVMGVVGWILSDLAAKNLPSGMFNVSGLRIIAASLIGIILSFTSLRKVEKTSGKIGYFLLFFVLAAIGAKAKFTNLSSAAILIGAGFLIVFGHVIFLFVFSRVIRAPLFLVAVASQANIGGVASAPIVASVYQPALAGVGLLLAVCGNITGTYLGIFTAYLCRWMAHL